MIQIETILLIFLFLQRIFAGPITKNRKKYLDKLSGTYKKTNFYYFCWNIKESSVWKECVYCKISRPWHQTFWPEPLKRLKEAAWSFSCWRQSEVWSSYIQWPWMCTADFERNLTTKLFQDSTSGLFYPWQTAAVAWCWMTRYSVALSICFLNLI